MPSRCVKGKQLLLSHQTSPWACSSPLRHGIGRIGASACTLHANPCKLAFLPTSWCFAPPTTPKGSPCESATFEGVPPSLVDRIQVRGGTSVGGIYRQVCMDLHSGKARSG